MAPAVTDQPLPEQIGMGGSCDAVSASASRSPGEEGADSNFPLPKGLEEIGEHSPLYPTDGGGDVTEEEFQWMEARRPLIATATTLGLDFGAEMATEIQAAFQEAKLTHLMGSLNWPGVGTRWRSFLEWCQEQPDAEALTPTLALRGFGRALGRVVTFRALALDTVALEGILDADCIYPSGQLRVDAVTLARIVDEKGVQKVCVARLFIAHLRRLLGHDPSISLHDDWQTTSLIASGYSHYTSKPSSSRRVHLFQVSCPKVESVGWTLQEVAERRVEVLGDNKPHDPWFCFPAPAYPAGVWFDGRLQRTERYGLYGVPFLSQRLQRLVVFNSNEELGVALRPFAEHVNELHSA